VTARGPPSRRALGSRDALHEVTRQCTRLRSRGVSPQRACEWLSPGAQPHPGIRETVRELSRITLPDVTHGRWVPLGARGVSWHQRRRAAGAATVGAGFTNRATAL